MTGAIRVGSKRAGAPLEFQPELDEIQVNIDRGNPLGNSHYFGTRKANIKLYGMDLDEALAKKEGPLYEEIRKLAKRVSQGERLILMCWCKPLGCHGDLIQRAVERLL